MDDLIKRDDALAACDIGPCSEWTNYTKDGYSHAADDCKRGIAALPAVDPVVIHQVDAAAIREAALEARIEELVEERDEFERLWEHSDFNLKLKTKELKTAEAAINKAVILMRNLYEGDRTHEMHDFIIRYGETK